MDDWVVCDVCGKTFCKKGIGSHKWRVHGDGQNFMPIKKGSSSWSKGLTKETSESVRKQAEKIKRVKSPLELELDDDNKLKQKWINKRVNAKKRRFDL